MSALSKLTAAFASATNELTLAAANFNFDFSLMKVEAPVEFHGLGRGLSDQRRTEAESGLPHITARKLGAFYKDIPPSIPELVKAYGKRVSEIAETPAVNPRGEQAEQYSQATSAQMAPQFGWLQHLVQELCKSNSLCACLLAFGKVPKPRPFGLSL